VPVGGGPRAVAVDPGLGLVFVTNWDDHTIAIVDESSLSVVGAVFVGAEPGDKLGSGLAVDTANHLLWVAHEEPVDHSSGQAPPLESGYLGANALALIDEQSLEVSADLLLGDTLSLALDPANNLAFVAIGSGTSVSAPDRVRVLALDTQATLNSVSLATAVLPASMAVDPATGLLFLAEPGLQNLVVFDHTTILNAASQAAARRGPPISWQGVSQGTWAVAADTATHIVYALNHPDPILSGDSGPATLVALDEATLNVRAGASLYGSPRGPALDAFTHVLYVTDPDGGTVTALQGLTP